MGGTWSGVTVVAILVWCAFGPICGTAELNRDAAVGVWLMDERVGDEVVDWTNRGLDGAFTGFPKRVDGKFGRGVELSGAGDTIMIPGFAETFPTEEVTIVAWVKVLKMKDQDLFSFEPADPGRATVMFPRGNTVVWQFGTPPQGASIDFDEDWVDVWKHWAFTHSVASRGMRTYVDAVLVSHVLFTSAFAQRPGDFHIGGRFDASLDGVVDEVAVFSRLLSRKDIGVIVAQGLGNALDLLPINARGKLATAWAGFKTHD